MVSVLLTLSNFHYYLSSYTQVSTMIIHSVYQLSVVIYSSSKLKSLGHLDYDLFESGGFFAPSGLPINMILFLWSASTHMLSLPMYDL